MSASRAMAEDRLTILTEDDPPMNFVENGAITGLATEIVREIERRQGLSEPIRLVPWARGYAIALSKPNVVLFATMRTEQRKGLFQWVGPLSSSFETGFYARAGSHIKINSLEAARKLGPIGVTRSYYTDQILTEKGFTNLDRSTSQIMMFKKLIGGRIDIMVSDNVTVLSMIRSENIEKNAIELVYPFFTSEYYIAFSMKTPKPVVMEWQKTLDDMKRDGTYGALSRKWLPNETSPASR
jgi:polar amino acid transport system substrate-binding protein